MLAHLEHFNLPPLLKDLDVSHVFFFYLFDGYLHARLDLRRHFNEPKLALAERLLESVEVKHIGVAQH